jgi:hypothetical protein
LKGYTIQVGQPTLELSKNPKDLTKKKLAEEK